MKKIKTIYILAALLGILIIIRIFSGSIFKKEKKELPVLSPVIIQNQIDSILALYEIESEWIKINNLKNKKIYQVQLPDDLPIPFLLTDINSINKNFSTTIKVRELLQQTGETKVDFINNGITEITVIFKYNDQIKRVRNEFGFIINDIEDISSGLLRELVIVPHNFLAILTPSENSKEIKDTLIAYEKQFAIKFSDDMDGEEYKIKIIHSSEKVKATIKNILDDFQGFSAVFFEKQSEIRNPKYYNLIKSELKKNNHKIIENPTLVNLTGKEPSEQHSLVKYYCDGKVSNSPKIFICEAEDFLNLVPDIEKFKKKGNRVVKITF